MKKVSTVLGKDLYVGKDEKGKPYYNIVNCGSPEPDAGYYSAEYIAKIHKVAVRHFFK